METITEKSLETAPSLPAATHPGRVHLRVANLERSLAFYRDLLGYVVLPVSEHTVELVSAAGASAQFVIEASPGVGPKPWRNAGLYHTAIRLPTRHDLACVIGRLLNGGWKIDGMADHGVSEAFYLADPDGNGVEIYRDRPRSEWPRRDGDLKMVTEKLDVKSLFALLQPGDLDIIAMPSGSDIGHIHLQVSDLHKAEQFYCGILGFDVMQPINQGALFISAGGYHHHIGLNVWAGEGVPGLHDDVAGLIDFTVLLPDAAAVEAVVSRIEAAGIVVQRLLSADGSPSVLVHDPDGIGIVLTVESTPQYA